MRLDTVFNDFVAAGLTIRRVVVRGDGRAVRPVVDVRDAARTVLAVLQAPVETVHAQAINVGAAHLNHRILELARIAAELTAADVEVLHAPSEDRRTYTADFGKFERIFPGFPFRDTFEGGRDLARDLRDAGLDREAYESRRFVRLDQLERLRAKGAVDDSLRPVSAVAGGAP